MIFDPVSLQQKYWGHWLVILLLMSLSINLLIILDHMFENSGEQSELWCEHSNRRGESGCHRLNWLFPLNLITFTIILIWMMMGWLRRALSRSSWARSPSQWAASARQEQSGKKNTMASDCEGWCKWKISEPKRRDTEETETTCQTGYFSFSHIGLRSDIRELSRCHFH